jgi:hypothetical protein
MGKRAKPAPVVVDPLAEDSEGKRHYGMKADTGFYRQRRPAKGYAQRAGKRQSATQERHVAIVNEVHRWQKRGHSEASAIRQTAERLPCHIKTVRKVWRKFKETSCKGRPEDVAKI